MKPKYHFFNNTKYALQGLKAMFQTETAFKLELLIIVPALIFSFFLPLSLELHLLLIGVLFLILIAECVNSAIEACVDLNTQTFHQKAKIAKDCASAGVFLSISLALITWILVLLSLIKG